MSKQKNKFEPVPFKLVSISTDDFSSNRENFNKDIAFNLGFGFSLGADKTNNLLILTTLLDFSQNDNSFINLKSSCSFEIEKDFWDKTVNNDELKLEASFITHLLVICIGTARGIIHELKPQWAEDVLLPTINISQMIENDITLPLN